MEIVRDEHGPDVPALTDLWHFLAKLPPMTFYWSSWAKYRGGQYVAARGGAGVRNLMRDFRDLWSGRRQQVSTSELSCNTTGCVAAWAAFRFPDRLRASAVGEMLHVASRQSRKYGQSAFAEAFRLPRPFAEFICLPNQGESIFRLHLDDEVGRKWGNRLGALKTRRQRAHALLNLSTVIEHFGGGDLYAGLGPTPTFAD